MNMILSLKYIFRQIRSKSLEEEEYWKIHKKLSNLARFKETSIKFLNYDLLVPDISSSLVQIKEIFLSQNYNFFSNSDKKIIFDCGSNVGLSVLYFLKNFEHVKIYAFEADPHIFKYLKINIENNSELNLRQEIILSNKAVWIDNLGVYFKCDGADGGAVQNNFTGIKVNSIKLSNELVKHEYINLLKLDVEGAEAIILEDCKDILSRIENIFIEYHSSCQLDQNLSKILKILEDNNFRYYIKNEDNVSRPFIQQELNKKYDLQLNIYARRI